jgi:hypothetical protein
MSAMLLLVAATSWAGIAHAMEGFPELLGILPPLTHGNTCMYVLLNSSLETTSPI